MFMFWLFMFCVISIYATIVCYIFEENVEEYLLEMDKKLEKGSFYLEVLIFLVFRMEDMAI